jgi:hypothetical protein
LVESPLQESASKYFLRAKHLQIASFNNKYHMVNDDDEMEFGPSLSPFGGKRGEMVSVYRRNRALAHKT